MWRSYTTWDQKRKRKRKKNIYCSKCILLNTCGRNFFCS
jgi:hypothetical protein